jgi:hypothetical protein
VAAVPVAALSNGEAVAWTLAGLVVVANCGGALCNAARRFSAAAATASSSAFAVSSFSSLVLPFQLQSGCSSLIISARDRPLNVFVLAERPTFVSWIPSSNVRTRPAGLEDDSGWSWFDGCCCKNKCSSKMLSLDCAL